MATLVLKNPGVLDVFIADVGFIVPAAGQDTYTSSGHLRALAASDDLRSLLTAGTLIANDGVNDLTLAEALTLLATLWAQAGFDTPASAVASFDCPGTVAVGDVVYLSAADTVDKASATDDTKPAIGVVVSKPTATTAVVRWGGTASVFAGLTPGATYYLSTVAGTITDTAPSGSGNIVQRLGFAKNATTLFIQIDRDFTVLA
jgi:hypothetical protein